MTKPTRLRPSQGGRYREVRPDPELVARIRATEDKPRGLSDSVFLALRAEMQESWPQQTITVTYQHPPKAPALPYFKVTMAPNKILMFPETERPAFERFCSVEWPTTKVSSLLNPVIHGWALANGLIEPDPVRFMFNLTPKGRDLWESNRKAPGTDLVVSGDFNRFRVAGPAPLPASSALADFDAWVEVSCLTRECLLEFVWPAESDCFGPRGMPLGLTYAEDSLHRLTPRGQAALDAGRARYG
jgi:hypothetical protein